MQLEAACGEPISVKFAPHGGCLSGIFPFPKTRLGERFFTLGFGGGLLLSCLPQLTTAMSGRQSYDWVNPLA